MTTAVAHKPFKSKVEKLSKRFISLETFFSRYSNREDGYKYEWHDGTVEKSLRTMNRDQSKIQAAILAYFYTNPSFLQEGAFLVELDMFIPTKKRTRRADMAFLTKQQMNKTTEGDISVASFVIEVISQFDKINEFETKLKEYFDNGVQVVWQIIPLSKTVKVFTSVKEVKICQDNDICSASPALPSFQMTVQDILK
jgi:Uma2 family endonuclease